MTGVQRWFAAWERHWFQPVALTRLGAFRALVMLLALYNAYVFEFPLMVDARAVDAGAGVRTWRPVYYMELLGLGPVGSATAGLALDLWFVTLWLALLGVCSRLSSLLAAVLYFWLMGIAYSWSKPRHDMMGLALAMLVLPLAPCGAALSVDALVRRWLGRPGPTAADARLAGFPIRLVQWVLVIAYASSGLSKVWVGGLQWFNGYTLQGIMLGINNVWSMDFAQHLWLCRLMSAGTTLVQCAFPLAMLWPASRWVILPAAILFHLVTWRTMDTGPYVNLWFMMVAFLPLERIPARVAGQAVRGPAWRRILGPLLAVGVLAGVLRILFFHLPIWTAAVLLPILALVCWRLRVTPGPSASPAPPAAEGTARP